MSATNCPKCSARVSVPDAADHAAWVRCRICAAEYQLREALEFNPPELELIAEPAIPAQPQLPAWAAAAAGGTGLLAASSAMSGMASAGEADTLPLNGSQPYNAQSGNDTNQWDLASDSELAQRTPGDDGGHSEGDDAATFDDSLLLDDSNPDDKTSEYADFGAIGDTAGGELSLDQMHEADGGAGIGKQSGAMDDPPASAEIENRSASDAAVGDPDDFFNFASEDPAATDAETHAYEAAFDPDAPAFSEADATGHDEEFRLADDQSAEEGDSKYKTEGMNPAYAPAAGMSATSAAALAGATAVATKARKKPPKINPILTLIGLVGGGAVGLSIAYAILMWLFAMDPFKLGPMLPGFMVPQALQGSKPPQLAARTDVPVDEGAITDENLADPNSTDPNRVDPNSTDPSSVDPNAAMPADPNTANPDITTAAPTTDPIDPFGAPPTTTITPPVDPVVDTTGNPFAEPSGTGNQKTDPAMTKDATKDATKEPAADPLADPFGPKSDPVRPAADPFSPEPKTDPATDPKTPATTDPAADPFAPAADPLTKPDPLTTPDPLAKPDPLMPKDPLDATIPAPNLTPSDPFAIPADPKTEPKAALVEVVGPKFESPVIEEDFQKILEQVNMTASEFKSAPEAEVTRRKGAFYQSLTKLGEAATFVPMSETGERLGHRPMVSENLLGRVVGDAAMADELGRLANLWMGAPSRKSPGIVLGGKVESAKQVGKFYEVTVMLPGTEPKTKPQSVVVVMAEKPVAAVEAGDNFVALGVIVDDPKTNLPGYTGEVTRVIWAAVGTAENKLMRD